jgi:hypothetical protein
MYNVRGMILIIVCQRNCWVLLWSFGFFLVPYSPHTKGKLDDKLANRKNEPEANLEDRYTAPITEVLRRYNVPKTIDYISLDVEGSEYEIMKDFPFEEYRIQVMTVERPSKQLKELLESKGYVHLKRLAWWGETLWAHSSTGFTPEHPKIAKIVTEERN